MKLCKICERVKPDFMFYKKWFCCPAGCVFQRTCICKKCAEQIGYDAVIEKADKLDT